jgi:hypothetical protein
MLDSIAFGFMLILLILVRLRPEIEQGHEPVGMLCCNAATPWI